MTARERAVAAVEDTLLNAALHHRHRAEQIVRAIEEAGLLIAPAPSPEVIESAVQLVYDHGSEHREFHGRCEDDAMKVAGWLVDSATVKP